MARMQQFIFSLFIIDRSLGLVIPPIHDLRQSGSHLSFSAVSEQSDFAVDPLLFNVLHEASTVDLGGVQQATQGIATWRSALLKGRLPLVESEAVWPVEPLFSKLVDAMVEMQLPRFVLRHPDTVTVVLLSLLRLTIEFSDMMKKVAWDRAQLEEDEGAEHDLYDDYEEFEVFLEEPTIFDFDAIAQEDVAQRIADEIANGFFDQWGGIVGGVRLLDQLFGADHGLLDIRDSGDAGGFGLEDGIWQHTGWKVIPELQSEISNMPELRDLMNQLGRRPTALKSDAIHKFAPRKLKQDGAQGAQFDPQMRDSVSGLTLSGSLTEMLPSEAMLLRGSPALRRLFLAKKVESKLLSYQQSGWEDVPSVPIPRSSFLRRMPSSPGGPIVVCLDTSWSMSGRREQLSKAVVLSCVTAAHKQRRDCQVVAFSTERGTVESGVITPDASGIKRLLAFLACSFGGGTDVTGALKYAMSNLETSIMSSADILMVTDGEIPDPPVSNEIMEALDSLKLQTEMEIHGLLVGKSESVPLSRLCTQTHDFLLDYDMLATLRSQSPGSATSLGARNKASWSRAANYHLPVRGRPWGSGTGALNLRGHMATNENTATRLSAKKDRYYEDFDEAPQSLRKQNRTSKRQEDSEKKEGFEAVVNEIDQNKGDYQSLVAQATNELTSFVTQSLQQQRWSSKELDEERENKVSCWKHFGELEKAIESVGEGLVEREEEARLVVLAMVTREHILLLGVPGTGKSVLGRRLSSLCGGSFFQRLLTRFTTPEEIFGPLSLKSLENDEYRRCTEGFLPTASIAFLDEIFKANSAILNTLLTILNERKFDNGAGRQEQCPIQCVVGASNELPESDELDALYDRFLLRKYVSPVSDDGLLKLLALSNPGVVSYGVDDELVDAADDCMLSNGFDAVVNQLNDGSTAVYMGNDVCLLMKDLRAYMREEHQVEVSDRRLVQATKLLRVSAITHGRMQVDLIDCMLLQHLVWKVPEQRSAVREWLWENLTPGGTDMAQFRLLLDGLREEALATVRNTGGDVTGAAGGRKADLAVLEAVRVEINRVVAALSTQKLSLERHMELLHRSSAHLWLDPSDARAMEQLLLPRAQAITLELDEVAVLAASLKVTLLDCPSSPSNEVRLSVMESLWDANFSAKVTFTDEEMAMGMKEAKAHFDLETFRKWKRTRKKLQAATA